MDAASEEYVQTVTSIVANIIGANVVGTYLHGSAVTGGFDFRQSDIDILVVCEELMTTEQQSTMAEQLSDEQLSCPATELEITVVLLHTCRNPTANPPFEFHMSTSRDENYRKTINGHEREGDPGQLPHFALCRQVGRPLGTSRPTAEVFAPIPDTMLIAQMIDGLRWAAEHAPWEYAVLNACRAWKFADDRTLVSKIEGGEWAFKHSLDSDRELIQHALDRQRWLTTEDLDENAVALFVMDVRSQLESYLRNLKN